MANNNPYDFPDHSNDDQLNLAEADYDEVQQMVDDQIVRNQLPEIRQIEDLFRNERFKVEKGDPKMNLWEQGGRFRKVRLSNDDVQVAFNLIDAARKAGIKGNWTEKQMSGQDPHQEQPACIMIDLDIYQDKQECWVTEKNLYRFQHDLAQLFLSRFTCVKTGEHKVHSVVTKRPTVKWCEKKQKYKDGYHIYIYTRLTRDDKRYLIHEILTEKLQTKAFGKEMGGAVEEMLDTACCHVPPLLYGSCKQDAATGPYRIWLVYNWNIEEDGTCIISKDEYFIASETRLNFCLEMSCNWEGKAIKKYRWDLKPEFQDASMLMNRKAAKSTNEDERQTLLDELNSLVLSDPDADYIKSVLGCLKPERYNNRELWFKVVYALVKNNERYIPLAKWFSKKSDRYTDSGFVKCLDGVSKADYKMNIETIYHWASEDAPEKFRACNDRSCFMLMCKFVFDPIQDGKLGHAHYAELVWMFLKNKYKTDVRGKQRIWYEFIFPQDPHERGQVYKWCEISNPDTLDLYLHRKLGILCDQMVKYIVKKVKKATEDVIEAAGKDRKGDSTKEKALKAYYTQIHKNFKASARGLWADGFKSGIIKQAEKVFQERGFSRSLDQGLMDMGVGNGILQLSWDGKLPRLIKSYNNCKVSRYTSTPYKQFDPRDPLTRKLLKGLRSMHPDGETDAYEYKMCFKAATLDNRPRETIILMVTGPGSNGKSFEFELHGSTLGEMYCAQMPIAMLLTCKEDNGEAPKPFMMRLEAARCAYYEEGPICAILYMPIIKRITGCGNMPARNLFQEARTIKSRCYHFVLSNHDFVVLSHEEAVWRRLRYLWQSIIFKDKLDYNPKDPKHRLMDRSFNAQFIEDEATRAAYLGILVFQHMKLMKDHGGVIEHCPHPTIDKHTLDFRNRQDTLNRFITERAVISPGIETQTPLDKVVEQYCIWYDANIRVVKHYKQEIFKQLVDSALKDIIVSDTQGAYLTKGFRIMDDGERQAGETPFIKEGRAAKKDKTYSRVFEPETPDEYLDRVEDEWEDLMAWNNTDKKIDLTATYAYDEEDQDMEAGNLKGEEKARPLEADAPDNDAVNLAEGAEEDDPEDESKMTLTERVKKTLDGTLPPLPSGSFTGGPTQLTIDDDMVASMNDYLEFD